MTHITDEYFLNGKLYQKRFISYGCGSKPYEIREVKFPISKKKLADLNIKTHEFIKLDYGI